jgi:hypothetical protein
MVGNQIAAHEQLASYRRLRARLESRWPEFRERRTDRLVQGKRLGHAAERVTEQILEDLFVGPLDWHLADVNYQVDWADIVLTRLGVRHLIVEAKRPGALAWNRIAVEAALQQAAGYARRQKVRAIAVSDGHTLYAADVTENGLRDRVLVRLDTAAGDGTLWWLSVDGIYRPRTDLLHGFALLPETGHLNVVERPGWSAALHPKYSLPCECFAYVGDPLRPSTWHLPFRRADGSIDAARLPKAIQALLSNYRGGHATRIPEAAIPDVLVRLGGAAHALGRLPGQTASPAPAYVALAAALDQLGRLGDLED